MFDYYDECHNCGRVRGHIKGCLNFCHECNESVCPYCWDAQHDMCKQCYEDIIIGGIMHSKQYDYSWKHDYAVYKQYGHYKWFIN